jgi:hypothetical protein
MKSTFGGMQIDLNEHSLKHEFSIRLNRDSLSNVIDSSFAFPKHDAPSISTPRGMQINFKNNMKNTMLQYS